MLQNVKTKDFLLTGTVESQRVADDGKILSYNILTDKGYSTTRHRRFLRPLITALDPEIPKESVVCNDGETNNLPNFADKTEKPASTRAHSGVPRELPDIQFSLISRSKQELNKESNLSKCAKRNLRSLFQMKT